ncbi:MAG: prolipoprotein diacylglyceryl transferase [Planctomycetota bacterium]|nr:prolipoprotein diacylglyceryl transferase [Planctomycetota bacterium]
MLAVLNHPKLDYDWFTTTLLRWSSEGLVVYDRWVLNFSGVGSYGHTGGEVLLDFYYLCYLIAFIGVLFFFTRYRKQGWLKVKPHVPYDALLLTMIGVLVGAKTAYIFIYNPDFYFGPPPYGPIDTSDMLRRIFLNWSGMASHGAAAGVMCMAILWWLRARPKVPIAQLGDVGGIAAAFGAIWIRLANFMNAELYGRAAPEWLPWAMRFPVRSGKGNQVMWHNNVLWEKMFKPENPAQVDAWLQNLQQANPGGVVDQGAYVLFKNPDAYRQGYELAVHLPDGTQYLSEPAANTLYWNPLEIVTTPRHPSQLYQLVLEGVLVLIFLLILRKRVKRAGMVAAGFWIAYPVARFIGEFFRQPDVQFQQAGNELGTVFLGLSMGQLLSLLMACVGGGLMFYFARYGRVIADEPMYPPDPEKPKAKGPVSVTIEQGMGGSTGAGEIAGIETVRAALAEKEKEWAKDTRPEGTLEKEHDQQDKPEPGQPERGD